jgi:hypothetical protein
VGFADPKLLSLPRRRYTPEDHTLKSGGEYSLRSYERPRNFLGGRPMPGSCPTSDPFVRTGPARLSGGGGWSLAGYGDIVGSMLEANGQDPMERISTSPSVHDEEEVKQNWDEC